MSHYYNQPILEPIGSPTERWWIVQSKDGCPVWHGDDLMVFSEEKLAKSFLLQWQKHWKQYDCIVECLSWEKIVNTYCAICVVLDFGFSNDGSGTRHYLRL